jgi:AraC family ethanolamine operon transcriptional activator
VRYGKTASFSEARETYSLPIMIVEFEPTDFDELAVAQNGWNTRYRPLKREGFRGRMISLRTKAIQIDMEQFDTPMEIAGSAPATGLSCVLPFQHSNAYSSCGENVTSTHIDVFGPGREVFAVTPRQTHWLCVSFFGGFFEHQSVSHLMPALPRQHDTHAILRADPNALELLRNRCLAAISVYRQGTLGDDSGKHIFHEIVLQTAHALSGSTEAPIKRGSQQYQLARRTRDYILNRMPDPPTILEICAALDAPERTLHRAFVKVYGVAPKQFLKTQRLLAVRQALRTAGQSQSVCNTALRFGFYELGYFARDYKAMFGELPSTTLHNCQR